jgi:hypothetical protein
MLNMKPFNAKIALKQGFTQKDGKALLGHNRQPPRMFVAKPNINGYKKETLTIRLYCTT